jgi:hypothetical protein
MGPAHGAPEIYHRSDVMRFEIADWRFEVTWQGLLCQPIERGRANTTKKSEARQEPRQRVSKSDRHMTGLAVETFDKQTYRKGATK